MQHGGGPAEMPALAEPGIQRRGQVGAADVVVVQHRAERVVDEPLAAVAGGQQHADEPQLRDRGALPLAAQRDSSPTGSPWP